MFKGLHEKIHRHNEGRHRFGGHGGGHGRHHRFGGMPFGFGGANRLFESGEARLALLSLLAEKPRHGYELMTEVEARTDGAYRPSAGSIYPNLQQMEDEGLVTAAKEGDKTVYTITDAGRNLLEEESDKVEAIWERATEMGEWGPAFHPNALLIGMSFQRFAKTAIKAVVKKGVDPDEVRKVLDRAAEEIEGLAKRGRGKRDIV